MFYNWLKIEGDPHTWVTDLIRDYALPIHFLGLSTEDRRHLYPQKEVSALASDQRLTSVQGAICNELAACE